MKSDRLEETLKLVRLAQDGDSSALNQLLERYHKVVSRIATLRMGWRLSLVTEVEDIVQEVFVRIIQGIHRFEGKTQGQFRLWCSTLTENELRDQAKYFDAKKRGGKETFEEGRPHQGGESLLIDSMFPSDQATPSAIARRNELEEQLHQKLLDLPERHRQVIVLRKLCGCEYDEISNALELGGAASARSLYAKAMARYLREVGGPRSAP